MMLTPFCFQQSEKWGLAKMSQSKNADGIRLLSLKFTTATEMTDLSRFLYFPEFCYY